MACQASPFDFTMLLTYSAWTDRRTEVRFVRFLSIGFTTMAVINPLERKL